MDRPKEPPKLRSLPSAALWTVVIAVATALGTALSSYFMLPFAMQELSARASAERRAKGEELHCQTLRTAATLAAEIHYAADRGYAATIPVGVVAPMPPGLLTDKVAFEKRAAQLTPLLTVNEAEWLDTVLLHHHVLVAMRTSEVPGHMRATPAEGGFDANAEIRQIREGTNRLAAHYRQSCTETH
ncbi:hypothetical protein BOTU111921_08930 [Bordetella tumbae]|uniref:hypothetical protein n=1 Tax=Bordetella tumbae TaxID=1649139 RepID=UPI0039F11B4F